MLHEQGYGGKAVVDAYTLNNWKLSTVKKIGQHVHQTRSATERKADSGRAEYARRTQTSRVLRSSFVAMHNWLRTNCSDFTITKGQWPLQIQRT